MRHKGGTVSLTAFEAAWLRMVIDLAADEAVDALPHVGAAPRRIKSEPYEAWNRIVDKVTAIAPDLS